MDLELINMIDSYNVNVQKACSLLLENYNLKSKDELIKFRATHPVGEFMNQGMNKFFFHGRGCMFSNDEISIDWDFGFDNKWCGINPWLFAEYLKEYNPRLYTIYDADRLKKEFDIAVDDGKMIKKFDLYYLL